MADMRFTIDEAVDALRRTNVPEAAINKARHWIVSRREAASAVGDKGRDSYRSDYGGSPIEQRSRC